VDKDHDLRTVMRQKSTRVRK